MSTSIKIIDGTFHKKVNGDFTVERDRATISITRFYNGDVFGSNLQLTITENNTAYIHLTKEQAHELAVTLLNSFDYNIYPSE